MRIIRTLISIAHIWLYKWTFLTGHSGLRSGNSSIASVAPTGGRTRPCWRNRTEKTQTQATFSNVRPEKHGICERHSPPICKNAPRGWQVVSAHNMELPNARYAVGARHTRAVHTQQPQCAAATEGRDVAAGLPKHGMNARLLSFAFHWATCNRPRNSTGPRFRTVLCDPIYGLSYF
jgi:hypothetical protein